MSDLISREDAKAAISQGRLERDFVTVEQVVGVLELLPSAEPEPLPPIIKTNSYNWKFYHCPNCGREFYGNNRFNYCEKCGQAIKWEAGHESD